MDEMTFNIGLDFGTSMTKVCVQHTSAQPVLHEFIQFPKPDGTKSFFLPSRLGVQASGEVACGYLPREGLQASYDYFKIASAEDVHFRLEADLDKENEFYQAGDYAPFTPEFLSVVYLTYVLLYVTEQLQEKHGSEGKKRGGLLGRFISKKTSQRKLHFTVQLGLPTEYSSRANVLRKRKFESILFIANCLRKHLRSLKSFQRTRIEELQRLVATFNSVLAVQSSSDREEDRAAKIEQLLSKNGLSVFPESAAGLAFLIRQGGLAPGYFVSLDIGGGSSDVSFFRVNESGTTSYLASESLLLASNNIYRGLASANGSRARSITLAERRVREMLASGPDRLLNDARYRKSVSKTMSSLHTRIKRIFNGRVYRAFSRGQAFTNKALNTYSGQPCFIFGGGSNLPIPRGLNKILIHDNGNPNAFPEECTFMRRQPIDQELLARAQYVRPRADELRGHAAMLAVAYGLSFPHYRDETFWDESHYSRNELNLERQPHPSNEGMYIYNVVERRWT